MARKTGFLANVLNVPPLIFRFQFNPDLMSDKKSFTYDPDKNFGRWDLAAHDKTDTTTASKGIETLIGLDLQTVGPALINTKRLLPREGDHRTIALDFQLDSSPDLPPETRNRLDSIEPDLATLRSFMYPAYAITDLSKVLVATGLKNPPTAPPECNLVYGNVRLTCVMTDLNIKVTAFNDDSTPRRAEVNVTLKEQTFSYSPLIDFVTRFIDASKDLTGLTLEEVAVASPIGFLFD
jgi:hypothetical protein